MLIPKQITNSLDVAGFNNKQHVQNLGKFISKLPSGSRVLEIGVGWGRTTWEIMDNLPEGSQLESCDTFAMNNPQLVNHHITNVSKKHSNNSAIMYQMNEYKQKGQRAAFDLAVKQHKHYRKFMKKVHHCTSLEVLKNDVAWDCVYIDGLHTYDNVSKELKLLENVKYLCGDDYHPFHEGCKRAVDEFIERTGRQLIHDTFESGSGFWYCIKEETDSNG